VKTIQDVRQIYFRHSLIHIFPSAGASSLSRVHDYTPFDTVHSVGLP